MNQNHKMAAEDLARLIEVLGPDREQVVLVGAFAVLFYRSVQSTRILSSKPAYTTDIDFVVPRPFRPRQERLLEKILGSDFAIIASRETSPPKHFLQHKRFDEDELAPVYVEFLTPRRGREGNRSLTFIPGLNAQALAYLDLFLMDTFEFLGPVKDLPGWESPYPIRLPHPLWFVMQKTLMSRTDSGDQEHKRDKDFSGIYDVVLLFADDWSAWGKMLRETQNSGRIHKKWLANFRTKIKEYFATDISDGSLGVARSQSYLSRFPEFRPSQVVQTMAHFSELLWPK